MTFSHTVWASQVAAAADLPDVRLDKRLTAILVNTLESPSASIPEAAGDASQATAAYRFYANDRVTPRRCIAASPPRPRSGASTKTFCSSSKTPPH